MSIIPNLTNNGVSDLHVKVRYCVRCYMEGTYARYVQFMFRCFVMVQNYTNERCPDLSSLQNYVFF